MLTQIPAKLFEQFVEQQRDFRALTAKELKALVDATKPEQKALHKLLPRDKDSNNFVFARLLFDKTFVDAHDWRAVRKALAEIESRLPIKVQLTAAADAAYKKQLFTATTKPKRTRKMWSSNRRFGIMGWKQNKTTYALTSKISQRVVFVHGVAAYSKRD